MREDGLEVEVGEGRRRCLPVVANRTHKNERERWLASQYFSLVGVIVVVYSPGKNENSESNLDGFGRRSLPPLLFLLPHLRVFSPVLRV